MEALVQAALARVPLTLAAVAAAAHDDSAPAATVESLTQQMAKAQARRTRAALQVDENTTIVVTLDWLRGADSWAQLLDVAKISAAERAAADQTIPCRGVA